MYDSYKSDFFPNTILGCMVKKKSNKRSSFKIYHGKNDKGKILNLIILKSIFLLFSLFKEEFSYSNKFHFPGD